MTATAVWSLLFNPFHLPAFLDGAKNATSAFHIVLLLIAAAAAARRTWRIRLNKVKQLIYLAVHALFFVVFSWMIAVPLSVLTCFMQKKEMERQAAREAGAHAGGAEEHLRLAEQRLEGDPDAFSMRMYALFIAGTFAAVVLVMGLAGYPYHIF